MGFGKSIPESPDMDQKNLEDKELLNRLRFFEVLMRSLPGIFYVFDDDLNVVLWNKNVEIVTGYTHEEIKNKDLLTLFDGADREEIVASIKAVFKSGKWLTEARMISKDGRTFPYLFTGERTDINGKAHLVGVGLDMTQLKSAESALKESEALYRLFADRMTEGVMLFYGPEILFVNQAFIKMFGYASPEDFRDLKPLDLAADSYTIYFRELFDALAAGVDHERHFQARWKNKEGGEFWVEGRGKRITWQARPSILITARDITEIKQKEAAMQAEAEQLRRENISLRSSMRDRYRFGKMIGKSPAMQKVYELVLNAAATSANVIVQGESGTGKELAAQAVHEMSGRSKNDFVPVNCAAIPESLLESEFFGHKKGAFTGAHTDKHGYLDLADAGTLFLDEVGELPVSMQVKLLRAIEGGGYTPVGGNILKHSDFRIIAATNRNLLELSRTGAMREDFFFRIHIIPITMPPLRDRIEDIPLLAEHFLSVYSKDKSISSLPGQVMEELLAYNWPGNVRELQNVIQRYLTVKKLDLLSSESKDRRPEIPLQTVPLKKAPSSPNPMDLKDKTAMMEKEMIKEALDRHRWNKSQTAKSLGISRKTLFRKMKRFGL